MPNFEFFISNGSRVLQTDIFPKSAILSSCISAVRQFAACYACFFTAFWYILNFQKFNCSSKRFALTNRKKISIFDNFKLIQAFFNNFFPISPKWENIIVISPFPRRYSVKSSSAYNFFEFFSGLSWKVFKQEDELSSWSQQKPLHFRADLIFWPFPATQVQLQSRFSQPRGKSLEKPGRALLKTLCENWSSLFLLACESCKSTSFQNP